MGRQHMNPASYQGKIYIFGGDTFDSTTNRSTIFNSLDILDTVSLTWNVGSLVNAPLPRFFYTATLVDGLIYYIGGIQQVGTGRDYVPMNSVCKLINAS